MPCESVHGPKQPRLEFAPQCEHETVCCKCCGNDHNRGHDHDNCSKLNCSKV